MPKNDASKKVRFRRTRSWLRSSFFIDEIATQASLIKKLSGFGQEDQPDLKPIIDSAARIDLRRSAVSLGISERDLEARLERHRVETRNAAWKFYALGITIFLGAMIATGTVIDGQGKRLYYAISITLFTSGIFAAAFAHAFWNWQIRTRRLGKFSEFLREPMSWLPE